MKRLFAISLLLTLFIQAIPVLDFFCGKDTVVYSFVEEDKPEETKAKEKKEGKEFLPVVPEPPQPLPALSGDFPSYVTSLPSPYFESATPPPDPFH